jgi:hypothetical protein
MSPWHGRTAVDPIEQHRDTPGSVSVLWEDLKVLVGQVCEAADVPFEGAHALNRSTKRDVLEWIGQIWDAMSETFTIIAANEQTVNGRSRG